MSREQFWQIIETACRSDSRLSHEWDQRLTEALSQLSADEIIEWNHLLFDQLVAAACTVDLMAACCLMKPALGVMASTISDAGWLVWESGSSQPRSTIPTVLLMLRFLVRGNRCGGRDLRAAAPWHGRVLPANQFSRLSPARNEAAELVGVDWDFDNPV